MQDNDPRERLVDRNSARDHEVHGLLEHEEVHECEETLPKMMPLSQRSRRKVLFLGLCRSCDWCCFGHVVDDYDDDGFEALDGTETIGGNETYYTCRQRRDRAAQLIERLRALNLLDDATRFRRVEPKKVIDDLRLNVNDDTFPDPLNSLGIGVVMFNYMMHKLMWLSNFAIMFWAAYWLHLAYTTTYDTDGNFSLRKPAEVDLGLLVRAQSTCAIDFLRTTNDLILKCPEGSLFDSFSHYGVVSKQEEDNMKTTTNVTFGNDYCGNNAVLQGKSATCTSYIDKAKLTDLFNASCKGRSACVIDEAKLYSDHSVFTKECFNGDADASYIYLQAQCKITKAELESNRKFALLVTCVNVVLSVGFALYYRQQEIAASEVKEQYARATASASDFTIKVYLRREQVEEAIRLKGDKPLQFVIEQEFLNEVVKKLPRVLESNDLGQRYVPAIIKTTLVHKNYVLLAGEEKLASLYEQKEYEQYDKRVEDLNRLLEDDDWRAKFQTPIAMYVTFEHQETVERFHKIMEFGWPANRPLMMFGHRMRLVDIEDPPETNDLIRVNDTLRRSQVRCNVIIYSIVTVVILILLLGVQSALRYASMEYTSKYPSFIDCEPLARKHSGDASFKKIAELDLRQARLGYGQGSYQCYCQSPKTKDDGICDEYKHDAWKIRIISWSTSLTIVLVNLGLKEAMNWVVNQIGFNTMSQKQNYAMITVFATQFFNTAILPLILAYLGSGDFSEQWFKQMARTHLRSVLMLAVLPLFTRLGVTTLKRKYQVCKDKGLCCAAPRETACRSRHQWFDIYAGPEYEIQNSSAHAVVLVCVTFMYAPLLPNMLPILCLGIWIHYFQERYLIAYYFRAPSVHGSLLVETSFKILKYAPLATLFTSYIAFGNAQVFENVPDDIVDRIGQARDSHHQVRPGSTLDQGHLYLMFGFGLAFFLMCSDKMFGSTQRSKVQPDHGLGKYQDALPGEQKAEIKALHELARQLNFEYMEDSTIQLIMPEAADRQVFDDEGEEDSEDNSKELARNPIVGSGTYDMMHETHFKEQHDIPQSLVLLDRAERDTRATAERIFKICHLDQLNVDDIKGLYRRHNGLA